MTVITHAPHHRQHGVTLIIVMVMLLLATAVVLGSTRVGWLNEKLVGSESDQQRAFAAAEALLRDAEQDIRTRAWVNNTTPFFPQELDDLDLLEDMIPDLPLPPCSNGICLLGPADTLTPTFAGMQAATVGASYGEFTGANPVAAGNPLLLGNAWYWIEVFQYAPGLPTDPNVQFPDTQSPFVYRITAFVQGVRPGTRVWIRSVFVPNPQNPRTPNS